MVLYAKDIVEIGPGAIRRPEANLLPQGSDGRESRSAGGYSAWSRHRTFMTPSPSRRHSQPQSNRAATIGVFLAGKRKSLAMPRSKCTALTVIGPPLYRLAPPQR